MVSNEKAEELKEIISKIKLQNRLIFLGIIFIPLIVGFFIIKDAIQKKKQLTKLKENIQYDVTRENNIRINNLTEIYNSLNNTFLTYHQKVDLIQKCDSYLKDLHFFNDDKKLFDGTFRNHINKSINTITSLKDKFENYDNSDFVNNRIIEYDYLFQKSQFPLDNSQKIAVITDDTHNLVVAGAGSGKTEVLITRIAYLIKRKPDTIKSERILVLAFQNKAAREIQDRLNDRFDIDVKIKTFHSFGREILRHALRHAHNDAGMKAPATIDENEQRNLIISIFNDSKMNDQFQNDIINYMKTYGDNEVYKSKSHFEEEEQYYEYMRNLRYTALDGTKVKSEAERRILNFFITHDLNGRRIEVRYENPADWMEYKKENGETQIPKPDFFFPHYDIYLEHWAIDENQNVPEWFEGNNPAESYKKGMEIKKKQFEKHNKYLVETSHKDFKDEKFIQILEERLLEVLKEKNPEKDFKFTSISYEKLVKRVWDECRFSVKDLSFNINSFITIAKTYNLTPDEVEQRINREPWSPKQREFANIALPIYARYEEKLKSENKIDFSDMINLAVINLKQIDNLYQNVYDHILIDEYQDISSQRHELIKSLMNKNDGCKLFCVGDDWQSIMGFSGSNLGFFVNFEQYFDHPALTYLTVNYRSCKSIVETGSEIIKHNGNNQLQKETIAKNNTISPIKIYISPYDAKSVNEYYDQIAQHCINSIETYLQSGYDPQEIMILSRIAKSPIMTAKLREHAKIYDDISISFETTPRSEIQFMSVHKSKGLQARVVFLLNVVKGLYGFPCEKENPDIFEPATISRKKDREEEERRLFYVATTRAKEELIIYSQIGSESKFLEEIKDHVILKQL